MSEFKSLYDISWKVDEPTYREDKALSYSTLAKYERGGRFSALPTLFDKVSSPSLTFGSMVDTLITDSEEAFQNRFVVVEDPGISDNLKTVTQLLFSRFSKTYSSLLDIPEEDIALAGKECDFYAKDNYYNTRVKKIREECPSYYRMLMLAEDKEIVTAQDVSDARMCVEALKNSQYTKDLFAENDPFNKDVVRYYQLKFKGEYDGVPYRCMADELYVNYIHKTIYPIDLKTSSHNEWEFSKSFQQYMYVIQSRLYWRIIKQNLEKDAFFKDFKLMPYRFVVVNRKNCKPMVWGFPLTEAWGTIELKTPSGYNIIWRDPYEIGKELWGYLNHPVEFPVGSQEVNDIVSWLKSN